MNPQQSEKAQPIHNAEKNNRPRTTEHSLENNNAEALTHHAPGPRNQVGFLPAGEKALLHRHETGSTHKANAKPDCSP